MKLNRGCYFWDAVGTYITEDAACLFVSKRLIQKIANGL